ncbi:type II toxin-antitoxin system Phd/YefM family antitoxin [Candidatus Gottesmanbacteria bacterium]|nr:type II toxin-antitoxin system Phd/YefM family antitoxin [Candidatus Gottesmanbacteria bacterium]
MRQIVTAQVARNKFAEVLNTAIYGLTSVVITRFNKPQAVIINYKEYERLMNPQLRFGKEEWKKGFKVLDKVRARNKKIPPQKIEKGVARAVAEVRRRRVQGGG